MFEKIMRYYPAISILVFSLIFLACGREPTRGIKQMSRVLDSANLFTAGQEDTITGMIKQLETTLGPQIVLLTVNSIGGETINEFSIRIAEKIGIGRKGFDDGILITLAIGNQQARIEVGTGLEKIIKDEIAARILREEMLPRFKEGDFFVGVKSGIGKIIKLIEENKELIGQHP